MSFEVVTKTGAIVPLTRFAESITLGDRTRSYAISHGRAVDAPNWGVFGDGLEQPSTISLTLYLKPLSSRAAQRQLIEDLDAALTQTAVFRNIADLREYAVYSGRIMVEAPAGDSYRLDIMFWPTQRRGAFLDGFPLGALRVVQYGDGFVVVEPLDGVTIRPQTFTLGGDGESFTFRTLEATYGG